MLSIRNAYIPLASGLAGLYHPGVNRGWGEPRALRYTYFGIHA
jgi:hypothetical protein